MGPILSTANKTPNKAHIDPNLFSMSSPSLEDHIDMSYAYGRWPQKILTAKHSKHTVP